MVKEADKFKEVMTAVYKVNLHCPECASQIRKPLMRTQGVHEVDANLEQNEIRVKGRIDAKRIQERIRKLIKREVTLVVPAQGKVKETTASTEKATLKANKVETDGKTKESTVIGKRPLKEAKEVVTGGKAKDSISTNKTKDAQVRTTIFKVHLHCETCGHDLRRMLIKRKGIYEVKTDMKAQTLTVEGLVEPSKILAYLQKKVHKHAEIIIPKAKEKEEKKENPKVEAKSAANNEEKEAPKVAVIPSTEEKKIIVEFKEKEAGLRNKDGSIPYFVHYVYAPQLFSDENPNACDIL